MRCPTCQAHIPDGVNPCPACGQVLDFGNSERKVIDPELVGSEQQGGQTRPTPKHGERTDWNQTGPHFSRMFITSFPGASLPTGCLPSLISFGLTLTVALAYGLLAAIGFVVFVVIGRGLTFTLTVKHMMEGRLVNPWVFHIVTWAVCWFLVAWLSGNLGIASL